MSFLLTLAQIAIQLALIVSVATGSNLSRRGVIEECIVVIAFAVLAEWRRWKSDAG